MASAGFHHRRHFLCALTALIVTLLCTAAIQDDSISRPLPEFPRDNITNIFLASDEVWIPSSNTRVTMRMVEEPLEISIKLLDSTNLFGKPKLYLLFKCSDKMASFVETALSSPEYDKNFATGDRIFCKQRQPFTIERVNNRSDRVMLRLINNEGKVPLEESLDVSLEIIVGVKYNEIELRSGSLIIYNWDSVLYYDAAFEQYQKLSHALNPFFDYSGIVCISEHFGLFAYTYGTIKFLQHSFIKMINESSLLVRSHFVFSIIIRYHSNSCWDPWDPYTDLVISTGDPTFTNETSKISALLEPAYYLDLRTGDLEPTKELMLELTNEAVKQRYNMSGDPPKVLYCLRVSTNNKLWRYESVREMNFTRFSFTEFNLFIRRRSPLIGLSHECRSVLDRIEVNLISGMTDVLLKTPIICTLSETFLIRLLFNGAICAGGVGRENFRNCGHYLVSRYYTAIKFQGRLGVEHAGVYMFVGQNIRFEYVVNVISLPLFYADKTIGALKSKTVVTELVELFNLTCCTFQSGVAPVSLKPSFVVSTNQKPRRLSRHEFTSYLETAPSNLLVKQYGNAKKTCLQMFMPYVDKRGDKPDAFVVSCQASLDASITKELLGATIDYSSETTALVYYEKHVKAFNDVVRKLVSSVSSVNAGLLLITTVFSVATKTIF